MGILYNLFFAQRRGVSTIPKRDSHFFWKTVLSLTDPLLTKRNIIAAVSVLIQLCLGTTYAWSIFKIPLIAACGWSEVQTQSVYMTYGAIISLSAALGGLMADRFGPRIVSLCGGLLFGAGLIIGGAAIQMKNLGLLVTAFGVVSGLGAGWAYVSPLATLIRWFPDKRGMLTGMAVMGYGLGSFVLGQFGPAAILTFGVPATFYAWGSVSLIILVFGALLLVNPPSNWSPPAGTATAAKSPVQPSFTLAEALRTLRFWILGLMLFVGCTAGIGLISQLSPLVQEIMKTPFPVPLSAERMKEIAIAAGTVVALAGLFNGAGRLAWSWLSDAIGRKTVFILIFGSSTAGFLILPHLSSLIVFAAICFYLLVCYGGIMATLPALTADEFGPRFIGRIYGVIFIMSGLGGPFGSWIFAYIKETTGAFTYALYAQAAAAAVGLALVCLLRCLRLSAAATPRK